MYVYVNIIRHQAQGWRAMGGRRPYQARLCEHRAICIRLNHSIDNGEETTCKILESIAGVVGIPGYGPPQAPTATGIRQSHRVRHSQLQSRCVF